MPTIDPETDHLAEVAYTTWRETADRILPPWAAIPSYERIRWHWAVEGKTPEAMRDRFSVGIYVADWDEARPAIRSRWMRVFRAVERARVELARLSA